MFTGYFRDAETGNDYAVNRYMVPSSGSFITPDPSGSRFVNPANPQSWNMYAYAKGDPINHRDRRGLDDDDDDDDGACLKTSTCGECFDPSGLIYQPSPDCGDQGGGGGGDPDPPQDPSCQISLGATGTPINEQNVANIVPYAPHTNTLGTYTTIGQPGYTPANYGWFAAVQIQGVLFGDTDPDDWRYQQTVTSSGTVQALVNGQLVTYSGAFPTRPDNPFLNSVLRSTGVLDVLDLPGFPAGTIVNANLVRTFTSTITNRLTGETCAISWTETLNVSNGIGLAYISSSQ